MSLQRFATGTLPTIPPAPAPVPGFDSIGGYNGQVFVTCQWPTGDKGAAARAAAIIHALTGVGP